MWMDVTEPLAEVPVNVCPLISNSDFKTIDETIAYNESGMDLNWNFVTTAGAYSQQPVTPTDGGIHAWLHQGNGMYSVAIPASGGDVDNDVEGFGWFSGVCDGVLPWIGPVIGFRAAALNNLLVDTAPNAHRMLAGTALPAAAADGVGGLPISDAGGLAMDTLYTMAVSAEAWGSINSGIVFRGVVTAADPGVSFTIGGLAGQGAGAFNDANTPWYAYVFRDAGEAGAAPQGEQQEVTGYTSATGLFTTDAFTVPVAVGDDVLIMSGRIAAVPEIKAVTDNLPDSGALTALAAAIAAILSDTGTDGVVLAPSEDVYHADVDLTVDAANSKDEYTATWLKNGVRISAGITVPKIQVVKRADGTDLVAQTAMTQIGATGSYKYDEAVNRITAGEAVLVLVTATIDAAGREFSRVLARDSSS
jgi:hypothetical protein